MLESTNQGYFLAFKKLPTLKLPIYLQYFYLFRINLYNRFRRNQIKERDDKNIMKTGDKVQCTQFFLPWKKKNQNYRNLLCY